MEVNNNSTHSRLYEGKYQKQYGSSSTYSIYGMGSRSREIGRVTNVGEYM